MSALPPIATNNHQPCNDEKCQFSDIADLCSITTRYAVKREKDTAR